jgi:hypothetical protein
MSIPFTQFIRPNGDKRPIMIDMDADVEAKAKELIGAGCRFEAEAIPLGNLVQFECVDYARLTEDDDPLILSSELCKNDPEVIESVKMLVLSAHRKWQRLNREVA